MNICSSKNYIAFLTQTSLYLQAQIEFHLQYSVREQDIEKARRERWGERERKQWREMEREREMDRVREKAKE